jgi:hypothetical protein
VLAGTALVDPTALWHGGVLKADDRSEAGSTTKTKRDDHTVVAEGEVRWPYEARRGLVYLHADFDASALDGLLDELQSLSGELSGMLGLSLRPSVVHLLLFEKQRAFEEYVRYYFPGVPMRRALFIRRRGPGMIFAHAQRELPQDLRHELTHAIINANLPELPLWLDEGLAEYCEVHVDQRRRGHPHHQWVKRSAAKFRDVGDLEGLQGLERFGPGEYEAAWAWVHFLVHHAEPTRKILKEYCQEWFRSPQADVAASESGSAIERDHEPLNQRLYRWNREYRQLFVAHFTLPEPPKS